MATKKPVKKAVAAKKPAAKPAPKKASAPAKKAVAPAKKVAAKPAAKKATAPAKKKVVVPAKKAPVKAPVKKPVAKKPVAPAKKVVPVKKAVAVKPAPKKAVAPIKKTGTPPAKPVAKPTPAPAPVEKAPVVKSKAPVKKEAPKPLPVKNPMPEKAKDIKIVPAKPVNLPKINTKTARTYRPDFAKSVLDQPKIEMTGPLVKYSDAELAEFRELIQRKLESAKKELAYLQGLITRKDAMGGDDSDNRYMTMEDGSLSMEREQLSQMASRQITFIDHLEKALIRIENKTYGICRVTGKLIDKARLRAVPHATLSIEAKMGNVR